MGQVWRLLRAAIFVPVGIYLLILGIQAWATTVDFFGHAAPATAYVTGSRRFVDDRGNVSYCPLLRFRTRAGQVVAVQGANVCQDAPFRRGASMSIHYRVDRPTTVEVDGFAGTWFNPVVFSGLGLFLIVVPLLSLRSMLWPRKPPAVAEVLAVRMAPEAPPARTDREPLPTRASARERAASNASNAGQPLVLGDHWATTLPPLPRASALYLATLLVMVALFYALLVACLGLVVYLLVRLVLWTPGFVAHQHTLGSFRLVIFLYLMVGVFGYAVVRGLLARTGGHPIGVKVERGRYPAVFALIDEVASKMRADPIHEVYLTPETELGVWEETALYLPPGAGKRKIVMGMGALSYLTLDELRSILAHEYAHFSHGDTFVGRFVYRVTVSARTLLGELRRHGGKSQYLNPLYWVLRLFAFLYAHLAAAFSRLREYYADRRAVESYGQAVFARALITMYLEDTLFEQIGLGQVIGFAVEGKRLGNVYRAVEDARRGFDAENPAGAEEILAGMLAERRGRLATHPSLRERLDAQGIPEGARHPYPLPRAVSATDTGNASLEADDSMSAEPCAAVALFGAEAATLQRVLTDFYRVQYTMMAPLDRREQAAEQT